MDGVDPALLTYYIKNKKTEEKKNKINKSNDLKIIIKELEKRFYLGDMVNDQ